MKERPILFSSSMVRAILDGSKTMTRRIIRPQPTHFNPAGTPRRVVPNGGPSESICCPAGEPGDRLWVRETFSGPHCMDASDGCKAVPPSKWGDCSRIWYWADGNPTEGDWTRPRPSIHMPRWASRILLEITAVRVERLQDISEDDARAEGIERGKDFPGWYRGPLDGDSAGLAEAGRHFKIPTAFPKLAFRALWESINGPKSWAANPWVWVVEFRRVETTEVKP